MKRLLTMRRLTMIFGALFGFALIGVFAFQKFYVDPERKCAGNGQWYFAEERRCVTPVYIPDITRRPAGVSRAEASAEGNRDLVEAEKAADQQKAAAAAAAARDRTAFEAKRPGL